MDSALDFVTRSRHAWHEFRHPSQLDMPQGPSDNHAIEQGRQDSHLRMLTRVEASDQLTEFRQLVGILNDGSFKAPHGFKPNRRPQPSIDKRPTPNMGMYTTICDAEIKQKRNFKFFNRLITGCLGLQIVVAAALTALGAANGSRSAVTVFGAINTIIAGFLTYLKGTGLPNRLKYFQHEWGKIREYIEQTERDFAFHQPGLSVKDEIQKIRKMYDDVRADVEINTPDRFVSIRGLRAADMSAGAGRPPVSYSADTHLNNGKQWMNEKETEAHATMERAQGQAYGLFSNITHLKDPLEDKMKDIAHMEKEIESNGHQMVHEKKQGLIGQIQSAVKEVKHLGQEIEQKAAAAAYEKDLEAREAVDQSQEAARAGIAQQREALAAQRDAVNASIVARRLEADNAVQNASNAVRSGLTQQRDSLVQKRDAFGNALAEGQQRAEYAITDSTDVARAGLAQQRDALNAGLAQQREALNFGLSQQQDALDDSLTQQRQTLNTSLGGTNESLARSLASSPLIVIHAALRLVRTVAFTVRPICCAFENAI